jgi:hypothetical protein
MIDAMKQALEALEYHQEQTRPIHKTQETITALRQAIAEAEKHELVPESWMGITDNPYCNDIDCNDPNGRAMRWHNKLLDLRKQVALDGLAETSREIEQEPVAWMRNDGTLLFADGNVFAVGQAFYTAPPKREIEQTPDDLLRQSEREGWRYAKECEAEIKRLTDLNHQLVTAAKELGAADDVAEWDDAWAKMAKLLRQGEINATSSQDGR